MTEYIKLAGTVLIGLGILLFILSTFGLYRYKYVLNRMHIAAQSDSLGLLLVILGALCFTGFSMTSLKLIAVLIFFWLTGPVSSHIVAKMELGSIEEEDEENFSIENRGKKEDAQ